MIDYSGYSDFPQFVKDFLSHKLTIEGKSKLTVKEYAYDLHTFLKYIKHKQHRKTEDFADEETFDVTIEDIRKITISDIYEYLIFLGTQKSNNARTRARKLSSIKSFFRFLDVSVHLIDNNVVKNIRMPVISKTLPRYLELDEAQKLLLSVEGRDKERDLLILTIFLNCGLRVSELKNIKLRDIKEDSILIHGKGSTERRLYLNEATKEALDAYLKVRMPANPDYQQLILSSFGEEISVGGIQYVVKTLIKKSGLDPNRLSTHKLRHTAATLMYKYGNVDVKALQEVLGHKHLNTTEIYTHANNREIRNALDNNPLSSFHKKEEAEIELEKQLNRMLEANLKSELEYSGQTGEIDEETQKPEENHSENKYDYEIRLYNDPENEYEEEYNGNSENEENNEPEDENDSENEPDDSNAEFEPENEKED